MHATHRFYQACKKANIKPLFGLHIKVEPLFNDDAIHCLLFAKSKEGYQNLLKIASLNSLSQTLTLKQLNHYQQGLSVVLVPYLGELKQLIDQNQKQSIEAITHEFNEVIEHLYLGEHPQYKITTQTLKTLPILYTKIRSENERIAATTLQQIFNIKSEDGIDLEFKSDHDFKTLFDKRSLDSLEKFILDHQFDLSLEHASLPRYQTPNNVSQSDYLKALSHKGLQRRLKDFKGNIEPYEKRLERELKTINELGYEDYFLIVYDVIKFARKEGVLVGPGRGSAPGSLVSYVLGITSIDPIEHGLLFERFLNKARQTMPDIDMDFPDTKREMLIQYVAQKYGKDHVANICTFGTFLSKSALRDSARVLNIEKKYIEEMAKKVDQFDSVEAMIKEDLDVQNRMTQVAAIKTWLEIATKIEGLPRHVSTHAAGIILADQPLSYYTALQAGLAGLYQTQYAQNDLESLGLLKIDFLGLRNLSMIESVTDLIYKHYHKKVDVYKLPINDEKTFKLLRESSTTGIFQLESSGMRQLIKRMRMRTFDDIVTVLALYRPGPMESIQTYLKRRHKKESVSYLTDELKPILSSTEGILLYQEQIMAIATDFAGYSLNEADILRRAVSKKDETILKKERANFVKHAVKNKKDEALAHNIYDYIVKFANYGFNKSHSVAYAMVAYWMAYLKANYPAPFIAVLMQSALNNETALKLYLQEAYAHKINVLAPDINKSKDYFVLDKQSLYYPVSGIKNIGNQTVKQVLQEREQGPFTSFVNAIVRLYKIMNKRQLTMLIYSGAFDQFKWNKRTMIENLEAIIHYVSFEGALNADDFVMQESKPYELDKLKHFEYEALGFNLTYDIFNDYRSVFNQPNIYAIEDIKSLPVEKQYTFVAQIANVKEITTKKGDLMAFVSLSGRYEQIDAVCFPSVYGRAQNDLIKNSVRIIKGKVTLKEGKRQIILEAISLIKT